MIVDDAVPEVMMPLPQYWLNAARVEVSSEPEVEVLRPNFFWKRASAFWVLAPKNPEEMPSG